MKCLRLLFVLLIALGLFAQGLSATAIVVFRQPTCIILAADSLRQEVLGESLQVCKVRPAGRWWVALTGYFGNPDLDVFSLVTGAVAPTVTPQGAASAIASRVGPVLRDAVERSRRGNRADFNRAFKIGDAVDEILIAGASTEGTLVVEAVGFTLEQIDPMRLVMTSTECPGSWCPNGALRYGTGSLGPVRLLPASAQLADSDEARRIITAQIKATPKEVGQPIDILEVTAGGAHWVGRDPASKCSAMR